MTTQDIIKIANTILSNDIECAYSKLIGLGYSFCLDSIEDIKRSDDTYSTIWSYV